MTELVGHPKRTIQIDPSAIDEEVAARIVLDHVVGLRFLDHPKPEAWKCEGWLDELEFAEALRAAILPQARSAKKAPLGARPWMETLASRTEIRGPLVPVTDALRIYISEMATTWRECFHRGDEFALVDHRGTVLYGRLADNIVIVHDVERWGHPNAPNKPSRVRAGEALRALRQAFGTTGQIVEKDLCCPDPAGRRVDPNEWPAHFPSNCPPSSLPDATGDVFYLIPSSGLSFQSTSELRPQTSSWSCQCEKSALSVWRTVESVLRLREAFPKLRTYHVARARLEPAYGKLARTGPSKHHMSLWLRQEYLSNASSLFEILHEHDQEQSV